MTMKPRSPSGFTLLEMIVALTMALVVTSSALGVLLTVLQTQREGSLRASLARDAQLTMDMLARDFAYLGVGVPRGLQMREDGVTPITASTTSQLRPPIRVGTSDYIAFLGDLPFPNSDLNGIAMPQVFQGSTDDEFSVVSELTACSPPQSAPTSGNYTCRTSQATMLEVGGGDCDESNKTQPTCPWGLGKWQQNGAADMVLVIGDTFGGWYQRTWDFTVHSHGTDRALVKFGARLSGETDLSENRFYARTIGGGFVALLDRVFYSLEEPGSPGTACTSGNCTLRRRQCWGDIGDPGDASFPAVGGSAIRGGSDPGGCTAGTQGTPWESVMDGVESFQIRYFDSTGAEIAPPLAIGTSPRVKYVDVELVLARPVRGTNKVFRQRATRRFFLELGGGLITDPPTPLASGGCDSTTADGCAPL